MGRAVAAFTVGAALITSSVGAAETVKRQHLHFPHLALSKDRGERVEAISVEMTCGRYRGISTIPKGWSVEMVGPSSEVTHLRASADHGTSELWSLRQWDGSIVISVEIPECFDVSASVIVDIAGESTKEYKFKRSELRLRP